MNLTAKALLILVSDRQRMRNSTDHADFAKRLRPARLGGVRHTAYKNGVSVECAPAGGAEDFQHSRVLWRKSVGDRLYASIPAARAVTGVDQLLHGHGGDQGCCHELASRQIVFDPQALDIEALRLHRPEQLLDRPAAATRAATLSASAASPTACVVSSLKLPRFRGRLWTWVIAVPVATSPRRQWATLLHGYCQKTAFSMAQAILPISKSLMFSVA
jgi:hypothetical protein